MGEGTQDSTVDGQFPSEFVATRGLPSKVSSDKANQPISRQGIQAVNNSFYPYISGGVYSTSSNLWYRVGGTGTGGGAAPISGTTTFTTKTFNLSPNQNLMTAAGASGFFFNAVDNSFSLTAIGTINTTFTALLQIIEGTGNLFPGIQTFTNQVVLSGTGTLTADFAQSGGPGDVKLLGDGGEIPVGERQYARFLTGYSSTIQLKWKVSNMGVSGVPGLAASWGNLVPNAANITEVTTLQQ